jgi:hypothetical protein
MGITQTISKLFSHGTFPKGAVFYLILVCYN